MRDVAKFLQAFPKESAMTSGKRKFGGQGLEVSAIGLGCMGGAGKYRGAALPRMDHGDDRSLAGAMGNWRGVLRTYVLE